MKLAAVIIFIAIFCIGLTFAQWGRHGFHHHHHYGHYRPYYGGGWGYRPYYGGYYGYRPYYGGYYGGGYGYGSMLFLQPVLLLNYRESLDLFLN